MSQIAFTNARCVLNESVQHGSLTVQNGFIHEISENIAPTIQDNIQNTDLIPIDCQGDYLMAGLIELHTDNIEKHLQPRPTVLWPDAQTAFFAHDAQIAAAGITTVFDSLSVGEYVDKGRVAMLGMAKKALEDARNSGLLRAEHFLHLRCEVADARLKQLFGELCDAPALRLLSVMDHTPGQRQWRNMSSYRDYYSTHKTWTDEEFSEEILSLQKIQHCYADENAAMVLSFAKEHNLPVASHDDTTLEHIDEALQNGIKISEFPTTLEAARYAAECGLLVTMGAPNIVRGGSSSKGNVSAIDVARAGYLGSLSSDYVPSSLLEAVFTLVNKKVMTLSEAAKLVSLHPANAVGLHDRGSLEPHKRADIIRVRTLNGKPVIRGVWRQGVRIF